MGPTARTDTSKRPRLDRETWSGHYDTLKNLYMDSDKPLPDVMEIMKEKHGFTASVKQYRYQLGEIWGWKKYNQGGKSLSTRRRKLPPQNNSSESSENVAMASGSEDQGRGITSLLTSLSELFTNRSLDKGSLASLGKCNSRDVAQCLRLCFDWCKQEIWKHDAQLPSPFRKGKELEIDSSDSDYQYDVHIFIYLLDRFIRSPRTTSDRDWWDDRAKGTIPFCPIMVLFTMSSLIVTAAINRMRPYQGATSSTPPRPPSSIFEFAKQGIYLIDDESKGRRWDAKTIVKEFCLEFQDMLPYYTEYGKAAKGAVDRYVAQNWPENKVNEELEFSAEEEEDYISSWNDMLPLDDQLVFQGE